MRVIFILLYIVAFSYGKETLYIASASSMRYALEEIVREFKKYKDFEVKLSWDASGSLYHKILMGAPYHIFISANKKYALLLKENGKGIYTITMARGKLAVVSSHRINCENLEDFLIKARKIVIANPKYAPYGISAISFLKKKKIYERIKNKLIFSANASHTLSTVISGSVDIGLTSLHILKGKYIHFCTLKEEDYEPIEYTLVLLKGGKSELFLEFLKSETAKDILRKYGFEVLK